MEDEKRAEEEQGAEDTTDAKAEESDGRDKLYKIGLPGKLILSKRKDLRKVLFS